MTAPLYDDGTIRVGPSLIETPTRLYPLAGTSVSLRRDPLWAGLSVALFSVMSLTLYGDLLHASEDIGLLAVGAISLAAGYLTRILRLEAPGQTRVFVIGRRSRIKKLYRSIADARNIRSEAQEFQHSFQQLRGSEFQ